MKIKVCWLYHDIMDLYGDKGNMMVLNKRSFDRGYEFLIDTCGIGEKRDLSEYDLLFLGGGADKEQIILMPDLLQRKDNIKDAINKNTFIFLVCGGYQLFGKYYIAADGSKVEGLNIYDYFTEAGKDGTRCIGNVVIDAKMDDLETRVIGFENHGGQTNGVTSPFGKVVKGYGNNFDSGYEGFYDGHILGTYLHGPLLPKNPEVADFLLTKAIQKNNPSFNYYELPKLENTFEDKARESMFKRLNIK